MLKKAAHVSRHVERRILMDGARANPLARRASADVTVPVVSRNDRLGRSAASAEISGSTALVSPTLAA